MAEKRTRRRFTAEFKAQAVRRLLDGGRGLSDVATELGLSTSQLSTWRVEHLAAGSAQKPNPTQLQTDLPPEKRTGLRPARPL
jgi:transposase-like protein